ncbi:DUF998 domain-containing protein [Micromonospora sp. NPDC023644]|uniref:DUF998 domain-containing protein n=1 Tax=Micromonospora sp. NPDC023644 TaxID=3154321 RepID=UPI0033E5F149
MSTSISIGRGEAPRTGSRPTTTLALLGGVVAGPLFLGAGLAQGMTRPGFDFGRNAISQLSLGELGWIQTVSFVLTGVLALAGAVGMRGALPDRHGRWVARLAGVFGASFLVCAFFAADPGAGFPADAPAGAATSLSGHGAVHMAAGMVGFLALCVALVLLGRHFRAAGQRPWAILSYAAPVAVLAGFAASGSWMPAFTLGAGLGLLTFSAVSARLLGSR